jgi:benzoate-CoA ligase family protein
LTFASNFNAAAAFIDRHLAEGRADKLAIRATSGEVSYGQLAERVNRFGNLLRDNGVGPGERLLMVVKDRPEFFYFFWGAIKAGVVPVAVNTLLRAEDYTYLIEDSACAALVYSGDLAELVEAGLAASDHAPALVMAADGEGSAMARMAAASPDLAPAPAAPTDDCFWLYSSGSTGQPKGVVHGHQDMVYTSELFARRILGVAESETCFSAGKLFFSYGFGNAMTFPLWVGGTTVLSDQQTTPAMTFEMIERFRPSVYFGVPTLYAQQLHAMDTAKPDLSSIKICCSAGEALPADIYRRWKEATGIGIIDGLGSTEALHVFVGNRHDDTRPGTSGKPIPGCEVRIVGEDATIVEPGEIGTLHMRGGSNAKYYWNNPRKTAETMLEDGWLNTGDMYHQDADGYFVNAGRGDDMLKVGGMWCSPVEIESRLIEHPAVLEAAVVGRNDEDGLTKPQAFIVLNDPQDAGEALEQDLRDYCKAGLDGYKYPRWLDFVEALPKTTTGKIQRFRLRAGS